MKKNAEVPCKPFHSVHHVQHVPLLDDPKDPKDQREQRKRKQRTGCCWGCLHRSGILPFSGWSPVDWCLLVVGLALFIYMLFGMLFCWVGGFLGIPSELCISDWWFKAWPFVAFPVPGVLVAIFALVSLRRVCNYACPWHWFLTWREVILSMSVLLLCVVIAVFVVMIGFARTYWYDLNACAWSCPWTENCWVLRYRAPRQRVSGRTISDFLHGPATLLTGTAPVLEASKVDGCSFTATVPVLYEGVVVGRVGAELRCPEAPAAATPSKGVLVLVTPPIGWSDHTWPPQEAVPTLRIDQVEPLYSSWNGAPMRQQSHDLGSPRSDLRVGVEVESKLPIVAGAIAFSADVGEAVLGALVPALQARGLTRFIAGGCSRDGKLAMRWGLVSTILHGVLSIDSGTGGYGIDSIAHSCHETIEILAHPERWVQWMRAGLWPGHQGWQGKRFKGDLDSMAADIILGGKELHVYGGMGMTSWATTMSVQEWVTEDNEEALRNFTWSPNYNYGHCHHNLDAPQRPNFIAFVRGEPLPDQHPWPETCTGCENNQERELATRWLAGL